MIIVMQILYYSDASAYAFAFFAFWLVSIQLIVFATLLAKICFICFSWAFVFAVIGNYVPSEFLLVSQALGIPITVASKVSFHISALQPLSSTA